jgi:hypothetical protein
MELDKSRLRIYKGAMGTKRFNTLELVRMVGELQPYPAVLWPLDQGGFDVIFTNFADLKAYGPTRIMAETQATVMLTAELTRMIKDGEAPPRPSDPAKLHADPDEPPGAELIMVEPDEAVLKKRLGIDRQRRESVLMAMSKSWTPRKK